MEQFKLQSIVNTYNNALLLKKYLISDYLKFEVDTRQLISSINTCNIIIITNAIILQQHGMDKSR
jgi:hypothetical protein